VVNIFPLLFARSKFGPLLGALIKDPALFLVFGVFLLMSLRRIDVSWFPLPFLNPWL